MTISFILLASNEDVRYFRQSLQCLYDSMRDGDELLVLFDEKFNPEFLDVVRQYNARYYVHTLNQDFAEHRNYVLNYAICERVFMLDCDEWASWLELDTLHDVPRTIDAVSFVRINPLVQRTAEMPQNVNEYNWQNFPDRQMRFFDAKLRYSGKLHEGIQGVRNELASKIVLIHAKDTDRAREQDLFYRSFVV